MNLDDMAPAQKAKAQACKTPEDILALAREEGFELSDEELNAVGAGQGFWNRNPNSNPKCPLHCPHV